MCLLLHHKSVVEQYLCKLLHLQQIPVFKSLSNKHSTEQSHPFKVNDKEVTDKMEIASSFNIFYLAQPKLEPN